MDAIGHKVPHLKFELQIAVAIAQELQFYNKFFPREVGSLGARLHRRLMDPHKFRVVVATGPGDQEVWVVGAAAKTLKTMGERGLS